MVLFLGQAGCTDDDDDGLAGATTGASGSMTSPGGESSGEASGQDSGASTGAGGSTSGADATDAASTDLTSVDGSSSDGPAPTGDLWVDETGAVIGLYELLIFGSATEVLVQLDADITWVVSFDHLSLGAVLNFGNFFYESTDCTGPGLIASTPGGDVEGLVIGAHDVDDELFTFVVPDGLEVSEGEFGSWVDDDLGGCLNFDIGIYPNNAPTTFYRQEDLQAISPPPFVGELTLEHH